MAFNTDFFDEIRSSIATDLTKEKIKDKCKWPIFVYDFINPQNNTEAGLKPANEQRNKFYQFSEIVKGNESIYLSPKGAITLTKHQGTGKNDGKGKIDGSYYDVKYSKDDSVVFYGMKTKNDGGNVFTTTTFGGFGDFTTISDQESIHMISEWKVSKELLTKFFFIPDVAQLTENHAAGKYDQKFNDNDIYYIDHYENIYNENTGDFIYSSITFSNIQFNLSQSGQTIEQHIYLASPGQGYLIPKILFDKKGTPLPRDKGWEWNDQYTTDRGIKSFQIEITGNYAFAGLEIWGIPVDPDHNSYNDKRWYAPRKLLVENFRLPLQEDFYKTSTNSNTLYITNLNLEATTDFMSYTAMRKDLIGDKRMNYQGIIETNATETEKTNAGGRTLQDQAFGMPTSFVDAVGTDWKKLDVRHNQWYWDGLDNNGNPLSGSQSIDYSKMKLTSADSGQGDTISAVQLMNQNSFILDSINRLPFETAYKLSWSLRDVPGFGGFLNKATFGLPLYWRHIYKQSASLYPYLSQIPMFISRDFYDIASKSIYASNGQDVVLNDKNTSIYNWANKILPNGKPGIGKIPVDMFQRAESDLLGAVFSNASNTSTLTFTLTDKMYADKWNTKTIKPDGQGLISSVMLNQQDGDDEYKVGETSYSVNSKLDDDSSLVADVDGQSYIITNIGFRGVGDGDARITAFYSDVDSYTPGYDFHDDIAYQTYVKTEAAYKNSQIREWFTNISTSYLDDLDKYLTETFNWPKAMPLSQPQTEVKPITETNRDISNNWFGHGGTGSTNRNFDYINSDWNGIDIEIYDFAKNGFQSKDDVIKKYAKVNLNLGKINVFPYFQLHNDDLDMFNYYAYLTAPNTNNSWLLRQIPVWDGSSTLSSAYDWKLTQGTIGVGGWDFQINKPNPIGPVDTETIMSYQTSKNGHDCGLYYFPYWSGSKLMLKLFFLMEWNGVYGNGYEYISNTLAPVKHNLGFGYTRLDADNLFYPYSAGKFAGDPDLYSKSNKSFQTFNSTNPGASPLLSYTIVAE